MMLAFLKKINIERTEKKRLKKAEEKENQKKCEQQ
jgi:hypothetical protein